MSEAKLGSEVRVEDTLDELTTTHQQMLEQLSVLVALVDAIEQYGTTETIRAQSKSLIDYFSRHARHHHAQEEKHIFPALIRDGNAGTIDLVRRLEQDHGWLEEDWIELAPMLHEVASGSGNFDVMALRPAVDVFSALYLEHIELEDGQAYPQARSLLKLDAEQNERARRQAA